MKKIISLSAALILLCILHVSADANPVGTDFYLLSGWQYGYEILTLNEDGTYRWQTVSGDEEPVNAGNYDIFAGDLTDLLVLTNSTTGKTEEYFLVCSEGKLILYTKHSVRGVYSDNPNDYIKSYTVIPTSELTETIGGREVLYAAENLMEGLYDKFWSEGDDGDGIGEALYFNFFSFDGAPDSETTVEGAVIFNGAPLRYFEINNRVKEARFSFDNDEEHTVTLHDTPAPQVVLFPKNTGEPINKGSFHIQSVYSGTKYSDCCMTLMLFFGEE
ncbi:MAG: NADase-type glycan-binding domain-containing protein [Spirochaetia bacterium]